MRVRIGEAHRFIHFRAVPPLFGASLMIASWKCDGMDKRLSAGFSTPYRRFLALECHGSYQPHRQQLDVVVAPLVANRRNPEERRECRAAENRSDGAIPGRRRQRRPATIAQLC